MAYAAEVARVDTNHDGIISAPEGDPDTGPMVSPATFGCIYRQFI